MPVKSQSVFVNSGLAGRASRRKSLSARCRKRIGEADGYACAHARELQKRAPLQVDLSTATPRFSAAGIVPILRRSRAAPAPLGAPHAAPLGRRQCTL